MRFAGYAAVFDRPDSGGDVVRAGAFARAVAHGAVGVPLLWQHDPKRPVGVIERIAEDARGLRVIGRLSVDTQNAREAAALLKERALNGLSFGYRVRASKPGRGTVKRELTDVDLVEISLVTFPMQRLARVHALAGDDVQ
jgi:HK97 family phage prohead protease